MYTSYGLFDDYGIENCSIVLIEACPCASSDEKRAKEGHYIKTLDCVNKNIAGRTNAESQRAYFQSEKGKDAQKIYQQSEKGKSTIKEIQKKYYERKKATQEANDPTIEEEIRTIINA